MFKKFCYYFILLIDIISAQASIRKYTPKDDWYNKILSGINYLHTHTCLPIEQSAMPQQKTSLAFSTTAQENGNETEETQKSLN